MHENYLINYTFNQMHLYTLRSQKLVALFTTSFINIETIQSRSNPNNARLFEWSRLAYLFPCFYFLFTKLSIYIPVLIFLSHILKYNKTSNVALKFISVNYLNAIMNMLQLFLHKLYPPLPSHLLSFIIFSSFKMIQHFGLLNTTANR